MGSLLKVTRDEVAKRVPGRDRGPVKKASATSRRAATTVGTDTGRVLAGGWAAAKGSLAAGKGVAGLIRARRDTKRSQERRKRAKMAAAAGAVTAAGGAILFGEKGRRRRDAVRGKVTGAVKGATSANGGAPNDQDLADKVRSEVFRPDDAPKGSVNVNVENGVVVLRGEVDDPAKIERIVSATRSVDGVGKVENLLHTPA